MQYLLAEFDRPDLKEGSRLPTIRRLAQHLGVSLITVQHVFHQLAQQGRIRTKARSGTFLVAPPSQAHPLTIGLSITAPSGSRDLLPQLWGYQIYGGMMNTVMRLGKAVTLLPLSCKEQGDEKKQHLLLEARSQVDGLILFPFPEHDSIRAAYQQAGKPVVEINPPSETATTDFVSADFFGASLQIGQAWKTSGRKRVALIMAASWGKMASSRLRLAGLVNGLGVESDGSFGCRLITAASSLEADGYEATRRLLSKPGWIPDAIYCEGDFLALGAMKALCETGLRIPEEVSVMGGTGVDLSGTTCPLLTRIRQPFERIGEEALLMLKRRIEKGGESLPGQFLANAFIGGMTTRPDENKLLGVI
jgi:LacI family transcriptional regulator